MSEVQISPLAKRLAEENSIDWRKIRGTGPEGRVIERDILTYLARIMSGEADLPAEPDKSEPAGPSSMPAAVPGNVANYAAASAGLAKEGVDLSALIGGFPPVAPLPTLEAPLDFGSFEAPAPVVPAFAPIAFTPPPVAPIIVPPAPTVNSSLSQEPVFEIDFDDDEPEIVFENPTVIDLPEPVVPMVSEPVVPMVSEPVVPMISEPVVPMISEPVVPMISEPVVPVAPIPAWTAPVVTEPVWSAPQPIVPPEPVWTAPVIPEPVFSTAPIVPEPVWTAPVVSEPVWTAPVVPQAIPTAPTIPEPVWTAPVVPQTLAAPEPVWTTPIEPEAPVWVTSTPPAPTQEPAWRMPEPIAPFQAESVIPDVVVPSIPEPVYVAPKPVYIPPIVLEPKLPDLIPEPVFIAPAIEIPTAPMLEPVITAPVIVPVPEIPVIVPVPEIPVIIPVPEIPVIIPVPEIPVIIPVPEIPVIIPTYSPPTSTVINDYFQLFAARRAFDQKALEDIRNNLSSSLNNREIPNELFLARAVGRAIHLLGISQFTIARLEHHGLQAYQVSGIQHSFIEALQGLSRATLSTAEGLLVVDASHLGADDLVLPSASGVLALGRNGKLTLSGNLPPLQSTEFLSKVAELLENPVGLVV
jgi:hypothetical protein